MNIMEIIESYLHNECSSEENKRLLEWLQENDENIRTFIREVHDHMNIADFFNAEEFLRTGSISFSSSDAGLDDEELKKAAGGQNEPPPLKP